ncbi:MAG TPA: beta/gamma crystallin-related protein [Casimicrobiaceae bacterium]|nr:beta/gamma crystallin-related protein [Casimicrobiaceae bacterium]
MKRTLLAGALLIAGASVTASAADLTLYGRQDFRGRELRANDTIVNLERSGFNDRASSAVIHGGVWQLCENARFRGQ